MLSHDPLWLDSLMKNMGSWENGTMLKAYVHRAGAYRVSGLHTHPIPEAPAEPWGGGGEARASQDPFLVP